MVCLVDGLPLPSENTDIRSRSSLSASAARRASPAAFAAAAASAASRASSAAFASASAASHEGLDLLIGGRRLLLRRKGVW